LIPGLDPIGAKISESSFDSYVVEVARADAVAALSHLAGDRRLSARE
jgi:hypothetical protein